MRFFHYMPCYHPLQASFSIAKNGKKDLSFVSRLADDAGRLFYKGLKQASDSVLSLPCGKCMGCRLERSRQWAMRCMHEAQMYEDNCFITLTYRPDDLPKDGSLNKKHFQDFMKRFRHRFYGTSPVADETGGISYPIRYYMCGEYGEDFGRPHYHACIFNFDFPDKVYWKTVNGCKLFTSEILEDLWSFGFCTIGDLTFESAAYVARYCTKQITGIKADEHYKGRQPEFGLQSNKPGIGSSWYDKWKKDCFPSDYLVIQGVKCKPPRYYDKKLEKEDPILFQRIKHSRIESAKDNDDNTYRRLLVREKCQEARFKKLIRTIERC